MENALEHVCGDTLGHPDMTRRDLQRAMTSGDPGRHHLRGNARKRGAGGTRDVIEMHIDGLPKLSVRVAGGCPGCRLAKLPA